MTYKNRQNTDFINVLSIIAPGTPLREGLENILRAKTGALIVISSSPEVLKITNGGFKINSEFTPANLYELAKMDGAIILSDDAKQILYANTQLTPDSEIISNETGIRHRTAERVAKQTGALVVSISQRRNIITLYKGSIKYILRDINVILNKANQAIQTLDKYKAVLEKALNNLSALELENIVTMFDVATVLQRTEMVLRIVEEIENYIVELGNEGRLVSMQLDELVADVEREGFLVCKDYLVENDERTSETVFETMSEFNSEELLNLTNFSRALGYSGGVSTLEQPLMPKGYRILNKIPRLPLSVIENLVNEFKSLQKIMNATIEELDEVEGIGEVRARAIKEGLLRIREQVVLESY
ncbi:MAG: diadenylate cyclase [Thermosediminibacterales bacterium]|nr:diadenylate cyclase [Thermosediminibacterales bacterium]MDK2836390.1 diadenylate cyclase [Thermosediminibacterales bacterium]